MPLNIKCKQNCTGSVSVFLNHVLMQFNMDTFLNHMSNSHLHCLRAKITLLKVVVTKIIMFQLWFSNLKYEEKRIF